VKETFLKFIFKSEERVIPCKADDEQETFRLSQQFRLLSEQLMPLVPEQLRGLSLSTSRAVGQCFRQSDRLKYPGTGVTK
jgi:hypothetical protein